MPYTRVPKDEVGIVVQTFVDDGAPLVGAQQEPGGETYTVGRLRSTRGGGGGGGGGGEGEGEGGFRLVAPSGDGGGGRGGGVSFDGDNEAYDGIKPKRGPQRRTSGKRSASGAGRGTRGRTGGSGTRRKRKGDGGS